jgi:hypothetical protein
MNDELPPLVIHNSFDHNIMKIAILSPFYPYRGGIAQFSSLLYRALEKEHTVKAFSFSRLYPKILFPGKTQYVAPGDETVVIPAERVQDRIFCFNCWAMYA